MCVFSNRENIGSVDHPEHNARARPNWNSGQKLIVRLGATANKKERRSYPHFCLLSVFGAKCDARGPLFADADNFTALQIRDEFFRQLRTVVIRTMALPVFKRFCLRWFIASHGTTTNPSDWR